MRTSLDSKMVVIVPLFMFEMIYLYPFGLTYCLRLFKSVENGERNLLMGLASFRLISHLSHLLASAYGEYLPCYEG